MFRLTNRLALSNLIKNRKLYYPYTLATILVIAITYIFTSLTLNSHLDDLPGADAIKMVLGLGLGIVALSSGIIVLYANSFVMKNRSKELGLYSVLGLEKRHLFSMILKETMIMGFVTLLLGIGVGALFDKLIYAFLQRLIGESTGLVSTFQVMTIPIVLVIFACIFSLLVLVNGFRLLRLNPLQLTKDGLKGEKKRTFPSYSNPFRTWDYGIWLLSCSLCSESSNGYYQFFPSCFIGHFRDLSSLQRWDNSSSATLEKEEKLLLQA